MQEDNSDSQNNILNVQLVRLGVVIAGLALLVGIVGALSGAVFVDGTIVLNANDGPEVSVETSTDELLLETPFSGQNVEVAHEDGSATFSSDDGTSLAVEPEDLEGDRTRITSVDAPTELTIDPDDKREISFEGSAQYIEFRDWQLDDDTVDIEVEATESSSFVLEGFTTGQGVLAVDSSGNVIDSDVAGDDGSVSLTVGSGTTEMKLQSGPSALEIRDEINPDELVTTEAEVELQFFAEDDVITRSTDDGTIDMTGLPLDKSMTVQVSADGYVTRQAFIPSILEQQDVYILPDDVDSVETTFVLNDRTGAFPRDRSRVLVEKPITRDGETTYQVVVSDEIGVGDYSTILERDARYRLSILNEDTDNKRVLGPYISTSAQTVELEVDSVAFDSGDTNIGYEWRADYQNETGAAIRFDFARTDADEIRAFELTIESRDGEMTLLEEQYGTVDNINEVVDIPDSVDDPESKTWVVEWEAEAVSGGEVENISGGKVVGADQLDVQIPGVGDDVMNVVSVLLILLVAGLFSAANVTVGGIVTSLTAGAMWFIGATPPEISGILIGTGLFISVIAHLRTNQQVRPV